MYTNRLDDLNGDSTSSGDHLVQVGTSPGGLASLSMMEQTWVMVARSVAVMQKP